MKNTIVFGHYSTSRYSNVILLGDNLCARFDGDIQVGETVAGEVIPDGLRRAVLNDPDNFRRIVKKYF